MPQEGSVPPTEVRHTKIAELVETRDKDMQHADSLPDYQEVCQTLTRPDETSPKCFKMHSKRSETLQTELN